MRRPRFEALDIFRSSGIIQFNSLYPGAQSSAHPHTMPSRERTARSNRVFHGRFTWTAQVNTLSLSDPEEEVIDRL